MAEISIRIYSKTGVPPNVTDNEVAKRIIPDGALTPLRQAFPGATAAVSAQNALDWMAGALRAEVLKRNKDKRASADQSTVTAGQAAEDTAMRTAWPEGE